MACSRLVERLGTPWLARFGLDWLALAALGALAASICLPWSLLGVLAGSIWLLWVARCGCSERPGLFDLLDLAIVNSFARAAWLDMAANDSPNA